MSLRTAPSGTAKASTSSLKYTRGSEGYAALKDDGIEELSEVAVKSRRKRGVWAGLGWVGVG